MNIWSYPKVYSLGHKAVEKIFDGEVSIQEKYDGSQFSWAWLEGRLEVRSKSRIQYQGGLGEDGGVIDKMFEAGVEYLLGVAPINGFIFRGEYFTKPKHNTIAYPRMPEHGILLYDIENVLMEQDFQSDNLLASTGRLLDLEVAQRLGDGENIDIENLRNLHERQESSLGGPMEGLVIKNYHQFGRDGKVLMAKVVSEKFKEKHTRSWKGRNPSAKDTIERIIASLNTEARFEKAVQHLRDDGRLIVGPEDIGPLMKEVQRDILDEEIDWITAKVMADALPRVKRGLGKGLPECYKGKLHDEYIARQGVEAMAECMACLEPDRYDDHIHIEGEE